MGGPGNRAPHGVAPTMGSRSVAIAVLSGVVMALGIAQVVRAVAAGAGPVAYVIGLAFIIAGAGRLYLWFRG